MTGPPDPGAPPDERPTRVLLVCSGGGHLAQLQRARIANQPLHVARLEADLADVRPATLDHEEPPEAVTRLELPADIGGVDRPVEDRPGAVGVLEVGDVLPEVRRSGGGTDEPATAQDRGGRAERKY